MQLFLDVNYWLILLVFLICKSYLLVFPVSRSLVEAAGKISEEKVLIIEDSKGTSADFNFTILYVFFKE